MQAVLTHAGDAGACKGAPRRLKALACVEVPYDARRVKGRRLGRKHEVVRVALPGTLPFDARRQSSFLKHERQSNIEARLPQRGFLNANLEAALRKLDCRVEEAASSIERQSNSRSRVEEA